MWRREGSFNIHSQFSRSSFEVLGIVGIQWGLPGSGYLKPKDVRDEDEVPLDITLVK